MLELVQNAEDNSYPGGVMPCLEFLLLRRQPGSRQLGSVTAAAADVAAAGATDGAAASCGSGVELVVLNNEAGFAADDVRRLCDVGASKKVGFV